MTRIPNGWRWIVLCKFCGIEIPVFSKNQREAFRSARKKHGRRSNCHTPSLVPCQVQEINLEQIKHFAFLLTGFKLNF